MSSPASRMTRSMGSTAAFFALACLCSVPCALRSDADSVVPRCDNRNSGRFEESIDTPLYLNWQYKPQDSSGRPAKATIPPAVVGSRIYTGETHLFRIDLDEFATEWCYDRHGDWYTGLSPPIVRDGTVYCTSGDGCAYAIEADSGKLRWKFTDTRGSAWHTPLLADGLLIFGSDGLYAVDCESGELAWKQTGIATVTSSPACDARRIYCGTRDGKLWAFDRRRGELLWHFQCLRPVDTAPVVSGGRVFFGADSVYAVDARTGELAWRANLGSPPSTWMATDGERLFVGCRDKRFYALELETGDVAWRFDPGDRISASPVITKGIVWVGSDNKKLYALDAETGKSLQKISTRSKPVGWVVACNGVLYVPCDDGAIHQYSGRKNDLGIELKNVHLPDRVETGETFEVRLTAKNTGETTWSRNAYSLAGELTDSESKKRLEDPGFFRFDSDLKPDQEAELTASLASPEERGDYTLTIDLARDGELVEFLPGHKPLTKTVRVRAPVRENPATESEYLPLGYFEFDRAVKELESNKTALVLVEDCVFEDIRDSVERYAEDVRESFGFELLIERGTFASAGVLRDYLREFCAAKPIQGVVLVGLHPYAMWKMKSGEKGPAPLYYCDLDGEFLDEDGDGFFEKHEWGRYPYPQIWASWIRSPVNSVEDYSRFFDKCHAYFTGELGIPRRGLVYVSHDWWMSCSDISMNVARIFGPQNVTSVGGREVKTQGEEYLRYLDEPYAVLDLWSHSGPLTHHLDMGPRGVVASKDILHTRGGGLIGFFWACHFGDIDEAGDRYGSTSAYLFGEGIGLAVIGVTRSIGTEYHEVMYRGLAQGLPLATSYLAYLREAYVDPQYQRVWNQDPPENFVFDLILFGNPFVAIPPAQDRSEGTDGTVLVRGKVVDSFWDKPVGGARVEVTGSAGSDTVETVTGSDGFFEMRVHPGECTVSVAADGLLSETVELEPKGPPLDLYFNLQSECEMAIREGVSLLSFPLNPDLVQEGFQSDGEAELTAVNFRPRLAQKESAWLLGSCRADLLFWDNGRFRRAIGKDAEGFLPTRGYILNADREARICTRGLKASPRWPHEVSLAKGWNLIGNPFDAPVPWDSVKAKWVIWGMSPEKAGFAEAVERGWIQGYAWELTPQGYLPARRLDPWQAQWVWAETASHAAYGHPELIISPPAQGDPNRAAEPRAQVPDDLDQQLDWHIRVSAFVSPEDGANSSIPPDLCNILGVSTGAKDRHDTLDAREPPPLDMSFKMEQLETECKTPEEEDPDDRETKVKKRKAKYESHKNPFISLAFANSDWGHHSGFYAFDIRAADGEPKSWLMVLRNDGKQRRIELGWEMNRAPASEYTFKMTDLEAEIEIDMTAQATYSFFTDLEKKARHFRIVALPKGTP